MGSINAGFQDKLQDNFNYLQTNYSSVVKYVTNINFKYMDVNKATFLTKKYIYSSFV